MSSDDGQHGQDRLDPDALENLLLRLEDWCVWPLRYLGARLEDIEDTISHLRERALELQEAGKLGGIKKPQSFFKRAAIWFFKDQMKRASTRRVEPSLAEEGPPVDRPVDAALTCQELRRDILRALRRIVPPWHAQVWALRLVDEQSYEEITARYPMTRAAARQVVFQVNRELRVLLREWSEQ